MENRWTLHIQNLGKIESADISVAPLTLFVGDNNSGKSYLMAILYTLLNIHFYRQGYNLCTSSKDYIFCANWIGQMIEESREYEKEVVLTDEVRQHFEALLNKILKKNLGRIAKNAFNSDVLIGDLSITFPRVKNQKISFLCEDRPEEEMSTYRVVPKTNKRKYTRGRFNDNTIAFAVSFILEYFIKSEFKYISTQDAVFLPTSRTGFLLTYKSLVRASISEVYDKEESQAENGRLTRPCSDFLKNLASISPENTFDKYNAIIRFIEEKMVLGHIDLSPNTPQPTVNYYPAKEDISIPMYLSSGVVTELTPLLLMLRYHEPIETLFIEEPEMGLHPELQLAMARVLIRIHAKKTPVFVTTHSDTMLQHFNNMIKLYNQQSDVKSRFMEDYPYEETDLLNANDVEMYQFDVDKSTDKSKVTRLSFNEYGFEIPTFNNALENLLRQSRSLEE